MGIKNRHGDTSFDTAVSLKKGAINTPSVIRLFQKENGGYALTAVVRDQCKQNHHYNNGLVFRCCQFNDWILLCKSWA